MSRQCECHEDGNVTFTCVSFEKTEKINNEYIQLGCGIDITTKSDVVAQPQKNDFRASSCFFLFSLQHILRN